MRATEGSAATIQMAMLCVKGSWFEVAVRLQNFIFSHKMSFSCGTSLPPVCKVRSVPLLHLAPVFLASWLFNHSSNLNPNAVTASELHSKQSLVLPLRLLDLSFFDLDLDRLPCHGKQKSRASE